MEKHYLGHRQRLKEKFGKNPSSLADYELAEILLSYIIPRRDVKREAKELVELSGSFSDIFSVDVTEIKGLGKEAANFFNAVKELGIRIESAKLSSKDAENITNFIDVLPLMKKLIRDEDKECFAAFFINSDYKFLGYEVLWRGTVDHVSVYVREVMESAIKHRASGVFLSHNHPSGDKRPSPSDIDLTIKINEALRNIDIILMDHVIITDRDFFSFKMENLIK